MQIRSFTILVTLLTFCTFCKGQDGSDISYYPTSALDSSFIGKEVHLDFYRRSSKGINIDTITLRLENTPIRFIERRKDNGFNNWFSEQFLESLDDLNQMHIKIFGWIILDITKDSIKVKPKLGLSMPKETLIDNKLFEENFWFNKDIIKEILVR